MPNLRIGTVRLPLGCRTSTPANFTGLLMSFLHTYSVSMSMAKVPDEKTSQ